MDSAESLVLKVWWGPTIVDNRGKDVSAKHTTIKTTIQDRAESKKAHH